MMNPFTSLVAYIDRLFEDYANPHARRVFHAVLTLAFLIVLVWQAAGENWVEALLALLAAGYTQANKANTAPIPEQPVDPLDHAAWESQPTHVDDLIPRTPFHDASDLYGGTGGIPANQPGSDEDGFGGDAPEPEEVSGNLPTIDKPDGTVNPPNRGWR